MWYLLFDMWESHPLEIKKRDDVAGIAFLVYVKRYTDTHEFLDYALKNYAAHCEKADIDEDLVEMILKCYQPTIRRCNTWAIVCSSSNVA